MKSEPLTCVLCGRADSDVRVALLRFESAGEYYFGSDPRCPDHLACQERVEAKGEDWPLAGWKRQRAVSA